MEVSGPLLGFMLLAVCVAAACLVVATVIALASRRSLLESMGSFVSDVFRELVRPWNQPWSRPEEFREYLTEFSQRLGATDVRVIGEQAEGLWNGMPMQLLRPRDRIDLVMQTRKHPLAFAAQGTGRSPDLLTGDVEFDSKVAVRGGAEALATLDAHMRRRLERLVDLGLSLTEAGVHLSTFREEDARAALHDLMEVLRRPPAGLATIAATDPIPEVRLTAMVALLDSGLAVPDEALTDPDPRVRAFAALAFERSRPDFLSRITPAQVNALFDSMKVSVSVRVVSLLADAGEPALPALLGLLRDKSAREPQIGEAVLDALGKVAPPGNIPEIREHAARLQLDAGNAIRRIRTRAAVVAGHLSVSQPCDGALTEPEHPGALSISKKETT